MKLQQLIRRYKNQTHQTNEQLAKQFHVSENTVSRWLRGEVTSLQEETAHNVSAVLGFDVSAMLKGKAITLKQPVLGHVKAGYDLFLESDYLGEESVSDDDQAFLERTRPNHPESGQPGCGRSRLHRTGGTAAAGKRAGPSALLQTLFLTAGLICPFKFSCLAHIMISS